MIREQFKAHSKYIENPGDRIDFKSEKWAVLFLNMGGPETLDEVEPYLYNIFSDRNIIKLPLSFLLQKPLARFISSKRASKTKENYRAIGGGSPLLKWTRLAAAGVEKNLRDGYTNVTAYCGMRYTPPFIGNQLDKIADSGCKHVVVVTLYPQYSQATTGTAIQEIIDWLKKNSNRHDLTFSLISEWYDLPQYIQLLKNRIADAMQKVNDRKNSRLLFSAHSLPVKMIAKGDPYLEHVKRTASLAGEGYDYLLSFQSRLGPVRWQGPETIATIQELGRNGVRELVIVPVSFVSDHVETLHEIDIELRELAEESGIENFIRVESFNDDPRFIGLLTDLVEESISRGRK